MKVPTDVLAILDEATTDGPNLYLPGQLDRPTYVKVDKALKAAGGKWNRSAKAHVFDRDAADAIDSLMLTGEIATAQELGYFPTPSAVVDQLLELAEVRPGMRVLEPSAGRGAIARPLAELGAEVDCVEIDRDRADLLITGGFLGRVVRCQDFLTLAPEPVYDRVVMNPPFARQQDIDHVLHALKFLRPGGRLVSVMALGVLFRQNRKAEDFRKLVADRGGDIEELPAGSFKVSGTGINTVVAFIPEV
ncbi:MAG: hypothetical protein JWO67_6381 [Streptosporangiaceae bacterium]|nr:hypothetical protein [Streptosporangiaceae bacterium]